MKHPAYHLRQNKIIERLIFIEVLRRLDRISDLSRYTYYGMGGPFLEDFRIIYECFPEINLVSIENNPETYKRQLFHKPCGRINLKYIDAKTFIKGYEPKGESSIFWLDYLGLTVGNIEEFQMVLEKVTKRSVVKITLQAESRILFEKGGAKARDFRDKFSRYWPQATAVIPRKPADYAKLIQDMLQISSQLTLPTATGIIFQPLTSFYYNDGTNMFTLTGILCDEETRGPFLAEFKRMPFTNLNWGPPKEINVPMLSTKERLRLQEYLPCREDSGAKLRRVLGYGIEDKEEKTIAILERYAELHRYFPYIMKVIP